MTKKTKSSSRRTTRSKKSQGSVGCGVLLILLCLAGLFVGDRLHLVKVDWQALLKGDKIDQVVSAPSPEKQPAARAPLVVEPVSGEWYQLYFTSPQYPDTPETRVDVIEQGLIQTINKTQRSLDIAIYELNLDDVGQVILAARDRGVAVRMVTDSDSLAEDETLIQLQRANIPIIADERSAIMHDKFAIFDGQAIWTGSWNFTSNDTFRNNNNAIYIQSPQLAQNYETEFEEMFGNQAFGPASPTNTPYPELKIGDTLIETCFAPEDKCANRLVRLVNQAQESIRFMAFSFTSDEIGQAIIDRAKAGVSVQGVIETRGSETEYSELSRLQAAKLDVLPDGNPYTLHHKVFVIDGDTVVFGSFNFTENADRSNDENMLVIHDRTIADQFLAEFDRVYAQAKSHPG